MSNGSEKGEAIQSKEEIPADLGKALKSLMQYGGVPEAEIGRILEATRQNPQYLKNLVSVVLKKTLPLIKEGRVER